MPVKRAASPDLVSKPSPFHSGVTVFEAPGPSTPRRSKRIKTTHNEQENSISSQVTTTTRKALGKAVKEEDAEVKTEVEEATTVKKKRSASPRKAKPIPQSLAVPHPAPPRWREQYNAIHEMRQGIVAPVDTMGCDQAQMKEVDPRVCPTFAITRVYHCLTSNFLGSQVLHAGVAHAVVTNERRSDRRGSGKATGGCRRNIDG